MSLLIEELSFVELKELYHKRKNNELKKNLINHYNNEIINKLCNVNFKVKRITDNFNENYVTLYLKLTFNDDTINFICKCEDDEYGKDYFVWLEINGNEYDCSNEKYKDVIFSFANKYDLTNYSIKEISNALWLMATFNFEISDKFYEVFKIVFIDFKIKTNNGSIFSCFKMFSSKKYLENKYKKIKKENELTQVGQ